MEIKENLSIEQVIEQGFTIEQIKQVKQFYSYVGDLPQQMIKDFDIKQLYCITSNTNKNGAVIKTLYKTHSIITIDNISLNVLIDTSQRNKQIKLLPFFPLMVGDERYVDLVGLRKMDRSPNNVCSGIYDKICMYQTIKKLVEYYTTYIHSLRLLNKIHTQNMDALHKSGFSNIPNHKKLWEREYMNETLRIVMYECGAMYWYQTNDKIISEQLEKFTTNF